MGGVWQELALLDVGCGLDANKATPTLLPFPIVPIPGQTHKNYLTPCMQVNVCMQMHALNCYGLYMHSVSLSQTLNDACKCLLHL